MSLICATANDNDAWNAKQFSFYRRTAAADSNSRTRSSLSAISALLLRSEDGWSSCDDFYIFFFFFFPSWYFWNDCRKKSRALIRRGVLCKLREAGSLDVVYIYIYRYVYYTYIYICAVKTNRANKAWKRKWTCASSRAISRRKSSLCVIIIIIRRCCCFWTLGW